MRRLTLPPAPPWPAAVSLAAFVTAVAFAAMVPDQLVPRSALEVVLLVGATAVAVALASLLRDYTAYLALAAVAVALVRIPVTVDSERSNLLLGLYAVLGIWTVATLAGWRRHHWPPLTRFDALVGAWALWSTASLLWAVDDDASRVDVAFFVAPFVLLYLLLRPAWVEPARRVQALLVLTGVIMAAALGGLYQVATGSVWQNPKVIVANQFAEYFRTNSIFWDPNVYGRYLAVAIIALLAWLVITEPGGRLLRIGIGAGAVLASALWFTYSQSSFAAVAAGALVLLIVRLSRTLAATLIVTCVVVAALSLGHIDAGGRAQLVKQGGRLAIEHPVAGVGIGSFETAYAEHERERTGRTPKLRSSHNTPVTVAAELGLVGSALYVAICAAALATGLRRSRTDLVTAWATASLAGVIAHSMLYGSFFEDPLVWILLAIIASSRYDTAASTAAGASTRGTKSGAKPNAAA